MAVVGLSADWSRPSYFAAKYLLEHGFDRHTRSTRSTRRYSGQACYPDLKDPFLTAVDVVDLFQRADRVPAFVDEAISIGARVLWMQLGVVNDEAAATGARRPVLKWSWIVV